MATELRVHGVSGTPAESMLDRPLVGRVAGDGEAGFLRPRGEYGATTGPGGATLEGYRWGNLTAGAAARAFWLLLLPFTLANVALWLRPPAGRFGSALVRNLCRVFALSITATFTLAAIGVSVDLVAWQCASPGSVCVTNRPWLNWAFTGFFEPTGRRLALAALAPLLFVTVLWELARRTWARYESYQAVRTGQDGDGLSAPTFWDGRDQVGRLRSIHIATALAVIDAVLLYVLNRHDRTGTAYTGVDLGPLDPSTVVTTGLVLFEVTLAVLAVCLVLLFVPAMVNRDSRSGNASLAAKTLRRGSLTLTALTLGYALLPRADWPTAGSLPGYATTVTAFFIAQEVLLLVLLAVVATQRHRAKDAYLAGFGAPIVASLALGLAAAFSAGLSFRVADFLDGGGTPAPADYAGAPATIPLEPPVSFQWAAFGYVGAVLLILLTFLWVKVFTIRRLRGEAVRDTDEEFQGGRAGDPERAKKIDAAIANARLSDHIGRVIGTVWILLAGAAIVVTYLATRGEGPVQLADSGSAAARVLHVVTNLGTLLISLTVLGLIVLGIQAYRNEKVRRVVGVIWDLGTFWPRAAHPLAPPCYAERVVPELVLRTTWLGEQPGGVLLSGHSQGSVLVAATVLQLPAAARNRTALLTYGSPLRRLYCRLFPAYVNDKVLAEVGERLRDQDGRPRWTNLWRWTDPIGGEVGTDDQRLKDPPQFDRRPGDTVPPRACGHSDYQLADEFAPVVENLLARIPTPADQPPDPADLVLPENRPPGDAEGRFSGKTA